MGLPLPPSPRRRISNATSADAAGNTKPAEQQLRRTARPSKRRKPVIWRLTGESVMPFSGHKGKQLRDIPLKWLNWLAHTKKTDLSTKASEEYKAALRRYLKNSAA